MPSASRISVLAVCAIAYSAAMLAALATVDAMAGAHPLAIVAGADLVGTLVVFAFSRAVNNSSVYDAYWSVAPPVIVLYYLQLASTLPEPPDPWRVAAAAFVVFAWGARLTFNCFRRWHSLDEEDWRYRDFRETTGRAYWLVSLAAFHLFPTVVVYLTCVPLWYAMMTPDVAFGALDVLGFAVAFTGVALETIADQQLHRFARARARDPEGTAGALLDHGLWGVIRHPNYLGEMLFWWGLWLLGAGCPGSGWSIAGVLVLTLMFIFISIPLKDRRMLARRPGYEEHMRRTPALIPGLRRR